MSDLVLQPLTIQKLRVPVIKEVAGSQVDPTQFTVKVALLPENVEPAYTDFVDGEWETNATVNPVRYSATALVGPANQSPAIDILPGRYKSYYRLFDTDTGETPLIFADYVRVAGPQSGDVPDQALGGDLTGIPTNATVVGIHGTPVSATAPTVNQSLKFNGTAYVPTTSSGTGDMLAANNLSELTATASTARGNIGLGTSAVKDFPASGNATGTQVVIATDTRLSDTRTPTDATVTSAKIVDGTIVDADISASAAIGPTKISGTAVITTDSRLSDARTPTGHHTSHETGGSDVLAITAAQVTSGQFAIARLASGTPTGSKFVRDDGVLAAPAGGGSVATDVIFDAKGDLPVGTGADTAAKLTVGANDTMLMADSAQSTGAKWGTPSTVKTALSLNNVPNTDMTNVANAASGVLAIARGGTAQATAAAARGASGLNIESVTTFSNVDVTVAATDRAVMQTGTMSASRVATLPLANAVAAGYWLTVGDASGSVTTTNTIVITRAGSDTINGATTETIKSAYGSRRMISDGTSTWSIDGGVVRLSDAQTLTNKTLTSPVVNTPTGIVKGDVGLGNVDNTSNATERAATRTLSSARITPRTTVSNAPGATPTYNLDNNDQVDFTGLAAAITSMSSGLTVTGVFGEKRILSFLDNGTARGITWGASFISSTVTLPSTTVISTRLYVGVIYNGSTWTCVAVA